MSNEFTSGYSISSFVLLLLLLIKEFEEWMFNVSFSKKRKKICIHILKSNYPILVWASQKRTEGQIKSFVRSLDIHFFEQKRVFIYDRFSLLFKHTKEKTNDYTRVESIYRHIFVQRVNVIEKKEEKIYIYIYIFSPLFPLQ